MNYLVHAITEPEDIIETPLVRWARYWLFSGVKECYAEVGDPSHLPAQEFIASVILFIMGLWLFFPGDGTATMPFTVTMQTELLHTGRYIPLWISALLVIALARIAMHFTIKGSWRCQSNIMGACGHVWLLFLILNLLSGYTVFGNALFILMYIFTMYLMIATGHEQDEQRRQEKEDKRTEAWQEGK